MEAKKQSVTERGRRGEEEDDQPLVSQRLHHNAHVRLQERVDHALVEVGKFGLVVVVVDVLDPVGRPAT